MTSFSAGGDDGDHRSLRPEHLILTKDQQRAKEALSTYIERTLRSQPSGKCANILINVLFLPPRCTHSWN